MEEFWLEIRQAFRWLMRNRRVTALAVVTIALAVGPNTTVFCIVKGVALRSLVFAEPERLFCLWRYSPENARLARMAGPDIWDLRQRCDAFSGIGVYRPSTRVLQNGDSGEEIQIAAVDTHLLPTLGVSPLLGRGFVSSDLDDGAEDVTIISHGLWQRWFAGNPEVLGQTLPFAGSKPTIVGVLPARFGRLPTVYGSELIQALIPKETSSVQRAYTFDYAVARLRPGTTSENGQAALDLVAGHLAQEYPDSNRDRRFRLVAFEDQLLGNLDTGLLLLLGAVGFVLLIACSNVASLLLMLGVKRRREFAARLALGASRTRIACRLILESMLIGLAGGSLGVLLGVWELRLVLGLAPPSIPRLDEVMIDGGVLLFSVAAMMLAGLVPGAFSAFQHLRMPPSSALGERGIGAPRSGRLAELIVVFQIALATVLLVGAGLMIRSFGALLAVDPGFDADRLLTILMRVPTTVPSDGAFTRQLQERIAALPTVDGVATISFLPFRHSYYQVPYTTDQTVRTAQPGMVRYAAFETVSPGFFQTMGIGLQEGRDFCFADAAERNFTSAIVSKALAEQGWPDRSALEGSLFIGGIRERPIRVVGVVGDIHHASLATPPLPTVYRCGTRRGGFALYTVVRASDPGRLVESVRAAILGLDASVTILDIATMRSLVLASAARPDFLRWLLGVMSGLATALALIGIYGVMASDAARRRREVAVRMALGASPTAVMGRLLMRGLLLATAGVLLGTGAALALGRLLTGLMYSISVTDPPSFLAAGLLLLLTAQLACLGPALLIARIQPQTALRDE